jgi:hypothetical protein
MVELIELTKDYYSKTDEEKLVIKKLIYDDMVFIADETDMGYFDLKFNLEKFINTMIENEDYEVADLLRIVFKEVEINYYRIIFYISKTNVK